MHNAPAVSYPVGRSHLGGSLLGLVGLAGLGAGLLWRYQDAPDLWRQGLLALTLLGTWCGAAAAWRRSPRGSLRWDGQAWHWISGATATGGVLTVHLDVQFCLVLRLHAPDGRRLWLLPERRAGQSALWHALRRAVFSRGAIAQVPRSGADSPGSRG